MTQLIIFIILMAIGYFIGGHREKQHYNSIFEREKQLNKVLLFDVKNIPETLSGSGGQLVVGHSVISVDYFKKFVAGLRLLFGGRLKAFESLLDRGRREAILRMKEEAESLGANMVFNIKFETSSVSKGSKNNIGSVEVLVYGSAIKSENLENNGI